MWKENIWRKKRYFLWRKRRVEKEKEENICRGKMSPWRDKQRTWKDMDFFGRKNCLCEKIFGVKVFLGENLFWVKNLCWVKLLG